MNSTNYRFELNYTRVRNIICSNPYNRTEPEDKDLLIAAVKQTLDNIQKLSEACSRLNHTIQVSVNNLKQITETLFILLEPIKPANSANPVNPVNPVMYQENTTTLPWTNPRSSGMKRTKRK